MYKQNTFLSAVVRLVFFSILMLAISAWAQDNTRYDMGEYTVYYNVFNSTLISADIATRYPLKRANNLAYLNVAVVKKTGGFGIPARVSGVYRNLMQQAFALNFIEIHESPTSAFGGATYYIAPIRFDNEEVLHIDIELALINSAETASFTVTKKFYR